MESEDYKPDYKDKSSTLQDRPSIDSLHRIIEDQIADEKFDEIRETLKTLHPAEIADLMSGFGALKKNIVFDLVPREIQHEVLIELEESDQEDLLERMSEEEIGDILENLDSDDAADVAALLDEPVRSRVLESTADEDRKEVEHLLGYDEESAGGLMSLEMVTVPDHASVNEAIKAVRYAREKVGIDDIHYVYMVDDDLRLLGGVTILDLLLADRNRPVHELKYKDLITIPSGLDQEEVAQRFQRYDLISAPVVNDKGQLVGRITIDDIVDVIQDEAQEDIGYLGGTGEEEVGERNILKASSLRLPWLLVSFVGELMNVFLIARYEMTLANLIIIAFFIPIIIAVAGNVGIQSSTIVIRGLASGEIPLHHTFRRVLREVLVGTLNGTIIALALGIVIFFWKQEVRISIAVGASMICVVIIAAITGSLTPILLKKTKQDPAHACGPFITVTNDVIGLAIYMFITTSILLQ